MPLLVKLREIDEAQDPVDSDEEGVKKGDSHGMTRQ